MSVCKYDGVTGEMAEAMATLRRVAAASCTVLVTGESGTGKEVAVRSVHDASPRRNKPFVAINCGAIAENLIESELFGHARGAFTGALTARRGLVAAAEGGTLFLDEVGDLSMSAQVKLLRLLQARQYTPVGETTPVSCDVRVISATNRDLIADVEAGRFREDLYFRLDVIHVHLPPLRERRSEIAPLAEHFLRAAAEKNGRTDVVGFAAGVIEVLERDDWPGNIRALENTIERAVLMATGREVDLECLPARLLARAALAAPPASPPQSPARHLALVPAPPPVADRARISVSPPKRASGEHRFSLPPPTGDGMVDLRAAVDALESKLIKKALERSGNNKQRAADMLNIKRTTLIDMMKRKGLAA